MTYRRSRKMAQRKRARRTIFLRTAMQFFGTLGYHATTVPMIVRAARSSTGCFYFCFRCKENIFAAALEYFAETIAEQVLAQAVTSLPARLGGSTRDFEIVARCVVGSIYESVHHWLELPPKQRPASTALATAVADFTMRGLDSPQAPDFPSEEEQETNRPTVDS